MKTKERRFLKGVAKSGGRKGCEAEADEKARGNVNGERRGRGGLRHTRLFWRKGNHTLSLRTVHPFEKRVNVLFVVYSERRCCCAFLLLSFSFPIGFINRAGRCHKAVLYTALESLRSRHRARGFIKRRESPCFRGNLGFSRDSLN